jgi:hypothetical protein
MDTAGLRPRLAGFAAVTSRRPQREVVEALEFLRTDTSRLIIAEDTAAHDDAIRVLEGIGWD